MSSARGPQGLNQLHSPSWALTVQVNEQANLTLPWSDLEIHRTSGWDLRGLIGGALMTDSLLETIYAEPIPL